MNVDKTKIVLTFAHPRVSREYQEAQGRLYFPNGWVLHVGIKPATWNDVLKEVGPGTALWVHGAPMIAASKKKTGLPLVTQWSLFKSELHKRGGYLIEGLTGLKSNIEADNRKLHATTVQLLRGGLGKKLPSSGDGPGRKGAIATDVIKAMWTSRAYTTNEAACDHMPMWKDARGVEHKWTATMCRERWGRSGRPWKSKAKRTKER